MARGSKTGKGAKKSTPTKKKDLGKLTGLSAEQLIGMLQRMMLIREFEDEAARLYRTARIRGVTHTYQGQEAVAVGAATTLKTEDYITSTHRGHAHVAAKG